MLSKLLTPGQIRKLKNSGKNIKWKPEDIVAAISLRSVSPKCYRYLRANNYPLPALSTLRTWAATFSVEEGTLHNVLKIMSTMSGEFKEAERLCVLSFDEIYMKPC